MPTQGELLTTKSGRQAAPYPNFDMSTQRKTHNSLRRLHKWLWTEALAEVKDNDYLTTFVEALNWRKLSPSDIDSLNDILFG